MKTKRKKTSIDKLEGFAICPPGGFDEDFKASESWAKTKEAAWIRFCHPALKREAYEADGFKPVRVTITFH